MANGPLQDPPWLNSLVTPLTVGGGTTPCPGPEGGATGAIAPGPRCKGLPRDEIYLFQIKYSF